MRKEESEFTQDVNIRHYFLDRKERERGCILRDSLQGLKKTTSKRKVMSPKTAVMSIEREYYYILRCAILAVLFHDYVMCIPMSVVVEEAVKHIFE